MREAVGTLERLEINVDDPEAAAKVRAFMPEAVIGMTDDEIRADLKQAAFGGKSEIRLTSWRPIPFPAFAVPRTKQQVVWTHGDPSNAEACGRPIETRIATPDELVASELDKGDRHRFSCPVHGNLDVFGAAVWANVQHLPDGG